MRYVQIESKIILFFHMIYGVTKSLHFLGIGMIDARFSFHLYARKSDHYLDSYGDLSQAALLKGDTARPVIVQI